MTQPHRNDENSGEEPRVVVRDRRRIDPETGQVRTAGEEVPAPAAGTHAPTDPAPVVIDADLADEPVAVEDPQADLLAQLAERTGDLQRLQAEYANYRKRVDRDREVVASAARGQLAGEMLSVLDDIERAGAHGDLTGAFKAVADKLIDSLHKAGLEPFGHDGEPFDPSVHEAVQHNTSADVAGPTVTGVLRRGYRFGDRVLRAALVAVTDAETAPPQAD